MRKVKYVGHVVYKAGIEIDQDKTDEVVNWPKPTNLEGVRRFLSFVVFLSTLIKDFSKISRTLTDLVNKEEKQKVKRINGTNNKQHLRP